jgi:hypothetical protein
MSTASKYLLVVIIMVALTFGIVFVLGTSEIPAAAQPARIQALFSDEIQLLRELAVEVPDEMSILPDFDKNLSAEEVRQQIDAMEKPWQLIEERAQTIQHPAIRGVAITVRSGDTNRLRMILSGEEEAHDTWTMLGDKPTFNNPSVIRLYGPEETLVRYEEVVAEGNGNKRIIEITFDLQQLILMADESELAE